MAKLSKEQKAYLDGMAYALKIAKDGGVKGLEKEIEFRGLTDVPLNVSSAELIAVARLRAREELMFTATAMASTMMEHIKMPPSRVLDYLKEFNRRVALYQHNTEEYEAAQARLNQNIGLSEVCKSFVQEGEDDGKQN